MQVKGALIRDSKTVLICVCVPSLSERVPSGPNAVPLGHYHYCTKLVGAVTASVVMGIISVKERVHLRKYTENHNFHTDH